MTNWQNTVLGIILFAGAVGGLFGAIYLIIMNAQLLHVPDYSEPMTTRPSLDSLRGFLRFVVESKYTRRAYFVVVFSAMIALQSIGVLRDNSNMVLGAFAIAVFGFVPAAIADACLGDPNRIMNTRGAKFGTRIKRTILGLIRDD